MSKHHPRYQAALDKEAVTIRNQIDKEVMMQMSLDELNKVLLDMVGNHALVALWWNTQNKAFHYATPKEIYEETPEQVINYVMEHYQR